MGAVRARRILVLGGFALAGLAAPSAPARSGCTSGYTNLQGQTVNVFCGPAHAKITYGGRTLTFPQGSCSTATAGEVDVNLGTLSFKPNPQHFSSVSIVVPARNGAASDPAVRVGWTAPPKSLALVSPRAVLTAGGKAGKFSGNVVEPGTTRTDGAAVGTFSCT